MVEMRVDGAKVMFFPDYMIAVQKQCNSFLVVKRRLHEMEFTYSLLFPAKLCVVAADSTHFFNTPEETWRWIESSDNCSARPLRLELTRDGVSLPKITAEQCSELDSRPLLFEMREAIHSLANGKAPGLEGLPDEFYKA
ncbi:hypothetical protein NDU88_001502 [Pleurodeles waltl]|uniref:Uncharacterized protein n=1 Tax=Pleurodeles waltl TaxID=8319 RepID=A0AAV7V9U8_PLEWA|nr:hypothetical protein NDU88_001502 [Pleurodeles waltl]